MKAMRFQQKGINFSYTPGRLGNVDGVEVFLAHKDGELLYTEESLIAMRDFFFKHNVKAVNFLISYKETGKIGEKLGARLGQLIKSVPTIQSVTVRLGPDCLMPQGITDNALSNLPTQFEQSITAQLETSTAHPTFYFAKRVRLVDASGQHLGATGSSTPSEYGYNDARSRSQKAYNFFANIPLLGRLVRGIARLIHGDNYKADFEKASNHTNSVSASPQASKSVETTAGLALQPTSHFDHPVYQGDAHKRGAKQVQFTEKPVESASDESPSPQQRLG